MLTRIFHYLLLLSITLISLNTYSAPLGKAVKFESSGFLNDVFTQLEQLEQGQKTLIRFTHIGDSHIIADFWTGYNRAHLQKRFGDGGRGFVLSGKAWRSYSQQHIRHRTHGNWESSNLKKGDDDAWFGPGGSYMQSDQESNALEIYTKDKGVSSTFDQLDILTFGHPQGGRYRLFVDDVPYQAWSTFHPWLSVKTHHFELSDTVHHIRVSPQAHTGPVRIFGLSMTRKEGGVVYDAIGLNGAQALHLLKNHNAALIQSFEALSPDLMIISFGINELFDRHWDLERYRKHFYTVLQQLRKIRHTNCLITGPFVALRRGKPLADMPKIYAVQRKLASDFQCAFWDTHHAMGDRLKPWQKKGWARKDGVHLSRHGYVRIAELFEESFMLTYQHWKQQKQLNTTQVTVKTKTPLLSNQTIDSSNAQHETSIQYHDQAQAQAQAQVQAQVRAMPTSAQINVQANTTSTTTKDSTAKSNRRKKSRAIEPHFGHEHSRNKKRLKRVRPSLRPPPLAQKDTIQSKN
jgi:lysophospholipase L1-like esterase